VTTATAPSDATVDVVVAGAGPAGAALALRLAERDLRVALVEPAGFEAPRVGESLAPGIQPLLVELGVWSAFLALGPLPSFGTRSHWGDPAPLVHSHVVSPWGNGWHVDRTAFDRMLVDAAVTAGAIPIAGASVAGCEPAPGEAGWRVTLRTAAARGGTRILGARFLVDATGRPARCASRLGARRLPLDRLVAAAVRFDGADVEREQYVLVEATPDGWWYSAPIPGGGMIAMLMTDGDLCRDLRLTAAAAWAAQLATAPTTRARVAGTRAATAPRVLSAASHRLRRTERPFGPWIAVGDAALAVDPISGSGVLRALRTARAGADTIVEYLASQSTDSIARYEADRDLECTRYLEERAAYYALEQRWPEHRFWARRAAAIAAYRAAM
jgi:flavin-dependent dehydrogenase